MEQKESVKKVLLIDDDPVTNLINRKLFAMHTNYKVDVFSNAQEALNKCAHWLSTEPERFPDIILLDINMPILDGWEFLEIFEKYPAEVLKRCTVYLLTSSIDADDIEKAKSYKSVGELISKPLTASRIQILKIKELTNAL